jgi:NADH-quinone oxidoreductase subunit J
MPLDIAIKTHNLKATNVDYTNYLLCFRAVTIALLTIFVKPIHSALYLVICFTIGHYLLLNSQFLAIVHIIVYSGPL